MCDFSEVKKRSNVACLLVSDGGVFFLYVFLIENVEQFLKNSSRILTCLCMVTAHLCGICMCGLTDKGESLLVVRLFTYMYDILLGVQFIDLYKWL